MESRRINLELGRPLKRVLIGRLAIVALLGMGCGLVHHDVEVSQEFQAGGGAPGLGVSFDASQLTGPLAASAGDLQHVSKVSLQSVKLEATDTGLIDYVSGGTLTITGNGLPQITLATLAAPGAVTSAQFAVQDVDLKPYLAAGATLSATLTYSPRPVTARGLKLTLVVRGQL